MDHFVVSARKYRPAVFVSVVGQRHITSTLKNAIARNQLAHAYLFCGPRGVGKTTCARIFAKSINCLSPHDNEACGECESCRAFAQERSFNIHELDAASNNSVDDIRTLTEQVRIPPQIGRYAVYIIDEVHMLSPAAFNAFLKTLEEPPAHAIFILATTEKHKIIPTILSRCQIYDFNRIRVEDSVAYLKYVAGEEGIAYDDESLNLIAQKADGGMRDALSMFDKAVSFCGKALNFKEVAQTLNVLDYDAYFDLTEMLLAGDYPGALTAFDTILAKGFSGQTFMTGLSAHFRDLLMCKNPQTLPLLEITGSLLERYKQQAAHCEVSFLFGAIALLTELESSFKMALNQRLHVELGLMKLCGLGQKKTDDLTTTQALLPDLKKDNAQAPAIRDAAVAPSMVAPVAVIPAAVAPSMVTPVAVIPAAVAPSMVAPVAVAPSAPADDKPAAEVAPTTGSPLPASAPGVERPASQSVAHSAPSAVSSPEPVRMKPVTGAGSPISGQSIASIMNAPKRTGSAEQAVKTLQELPVDPDAEQKIDHFKEKFLHSLQSERPRMAPAFQDMKVAGNHLSINVQSQELHDEIVRNRSEILELLAATAGITGKLELEVRVVESSGVKRPIKVEDRLKFLTDKNPVLTKLRKELDFEIE